MWLGLKGNIDNYFVEESEDGGSSSRLGKSFMVISWKRPKTF